MAAGDWKDMLYAAQNGDLHLVKFHIEEGENPNYQHPEFLTTPLIESVTNGHTHVVRYLLENGANPNIKAGFSSDTALTIAKQQQNKPLLKLLKSYSHNSKQPQGFANKLFRLVGKFTPTRTKI